MSRMDRIKDLIGDSTAAICYFLVFATPIIIGIIYLIIWAYALITYGDKPITDIPSWAYFIMRGSK